VIHGVGTRDMREMGGLGKQMPVVRAVFVIGALALAGLPVLNGFWSKELVLEAGLAGGPIWMLAVMIFTAGLTALYTFRCVWMVFYGPPQDRHAHDAGIFMKIALIPLALGTLVSWLAAEPFGHLLEETLPFHAIEAHPLGAIALEIVTAPVTWIALAAIALGLIAWWQRSRLALISEPLQGFAGVARQSFGFEAINRKVVETTQQISEDLRAVQTGLLSWNLLAIIAELVVIVIILSLGA